MADSTSGEELQRRQAHEQALPATVDRHMVATAAGVPSLPAAAANLPPLSWRWRGSGRSTRRRRLTLSQYLSLGRGHGVPPSSLGGFRGSMGFGFGDGFSPESVFGADSGFRFGFRFWVPRHSTRSEPAPLPFLSVSVALVGEEKARKVSRYPTTSRGKLFISHPRSIHVNPKT